MSPRGGRGRAGTGEGGGAGGAVSAGASASGSGTRATARVDGRMTVTVNEKVSLNATIRTVNVNLSLHYTCNFVVGIGER